MSSNIHAAWRGDNGVVHWCLVIERIRADGTLIDVEVYPCCSGQIGAILRNFGPLPISHVTCIACACTPQLDDAYANCAT